jgi:hypothetical protein
VNVLKVTFSSRFCPAGYARDKPSGTIERCGIHGGSARGVEQSSPPSLGRDWLGEAMQSEW